MHLDGANGQTTFTDEAGKTINNPEGYDTYTRLVLHCDGSGNSFIDSATNKTVRTAGDVTQVSTQPKFGTKCAEFFGTGAERWGEGDWLYVTDEDITIPSGTDYTIDFWVRFKELPTSGNAYVILSYYYNASYWTRFRIRNNNGQYEWYISDDNARNGSVPASVTTDRWYHVAITRDSTATRIFQDGVQCGSNLSAGIEFGGVLTSPSWNYRYTLYIGKEPYYNFKGYLDEIRISKGIARWTSNFTPPPGPYGRVSADTTQKKLGTSSARFEGGNYLSIPDSDDWNFGGGDFTIDFWIYPTNITEEEIMGQGNSSGNGGFSWVIRKNVNDRNDGMDFSLSTDGTTWAVRYKIGFDVNTWQHIAFIRSGNSIYIFKNGILQKSEAFTGTLFNSPNLLGIARIGEYDNLYFTGYLDEIRISKGIARWTSNFTPPDTPYTLTLGDPQVPPTNTIKDSIGDSALGRSTSASYKLNAGFLYISQTNPPNIIQTIPNFNWKENESKPNAFDLDDYFTSPDGLTLTYTASGQTNIAVSIDPTTHLVSFSQPQGFFGTETVRFTATDTEYNSTQSNPVSLQVEGVDNPPVLDFIPDITVDETELVKITPHATDLDGDIISYSFTAPLDSNGQWQTDYASAGTYTTTVTATDPTGLKDTQDVKITVRNINRAPIITKINGI
ncbi:MAG: LamG domain-containing protein, partial [Candidatus Omnitrophica bacterium]|nr:LamG domain-containing protein [Candidatus Omnitrophota bacterium]